MDVPSTDTIDAFFDMQVLTIVKDYHRGLMVEEEFITNCCEVQSQRSKLLRMRSDGLAKLEQVNAIIAGNARFSTAV